MYRSRMSLKKAWLSVGALVVAGAACTKPNPALSCADGLCSDPNVPFCDLTGSIEGEPNTCIKPSCTPNTFEECRGDKALMCNSTGSDYDLLSCSQGCSADAGGCKPEPPCETLACQKHIIPKYLPTECDSLAAAPSLTISSDMTLDTSMAGMCTRVAQQVDGPELCVLHYGTIAIESGKTLRAVGARALALVADTSLRVDGVVDLSAYYPNGAGGGYTVSGGTSNNTLAGGGAGGRTAGAGGGTTSQVGGAANGGAQATHPSNLVFLIGGAKSETFEGNGGGAVTLISCLGNVSVTGTVDVGGGGGDGGSFSGTTYRRPAGGGAGGTIVIQGMTATLTGGVFANGGGGGGGATLGGINGGNGAPGSRGTRSTAAAEGGDGDGGAKGGSGGTGQLPPAGGLPHQNAPGAGGGAAGFALIFVPAGVAPTTTGLAASPPVETNTNLTTN